MGVRGRGLKIGDEAQTNYNGNGMAIVRIIDADATRRHGNSQSGILFRVRPALKAGSENTWYDADWFEPTAEEEG